MSKQGGDDRPLSRHDPDHGVARRKPARAIDLGKFLLPSGARRPLHGEEIALQPGRIAVALERPGLDDLATGLAERTQLDEIAIDVDAGLFREFAPRGGQGVLVSRAQSFWNRPSALVLGRLEGSARMDEKDLDAAAHAPIERNARAANCHACALSSGRRRFNQPEASSERAIASHSS